MNDQQHPRALELLREMDLLRRTWKLAIPNTGINKSEFFTLYTLRCPNGQALSWGEDCPKEPAPMTLSTLAKAMKQSMPAVSQRITKLEELGYVRREQTCPRAANCSTPPALRCWVSWSGCSTAWTPRTGSTPSCSSKPSTAWPWQCKRSFPRANRNF